MEKLTEELIDRVQAARVKDYKARFPQITPKMIDTEHTLNMLWKINEEDNAFP